MSAEMIFWWTYLAGYLWFWRYHVGYLLDEMASSYRSPDGADFALSLVGGTLAAFLWPFTLMGRGIYVLWTKYGQDSAGMLPNIFPRPAQIETRAEKQERKAREARAQIETARRNINQHERENGLELTRWKD